VETASTLGFLKFLKEALLKRSTLAPKVLERPFLFRAAPVNIFKGTMFEADMASLTPSLSFKKAPKKE